MFDDFIYLLKENKFKDEIGQIKKTYEEREVFTKKKPITQNEFYSANKVRSNFTDIRPACCFVVDVFDYEDEQLIKYNNKVYKIYRVYEKNNIVELYCEVRAGIYEFARDENR